MSEQRVMYVCSECADNCPEECGHFDVSDLRLMPDGKWLCEVCFDETTQADRGNLDEDAYRGWHDLPAPRAWAPQDSMPAPPPGSLD